MSEKQNPIERFQHAIGLVMKSSRAFCERVREDLGAEVNDPARVIQVVEAVIREDPGKLGLLFLQLGEAVSRLGDEDLELMLFAGEVGEGADVIASPEG